MVTIRLPPCPCVALLQVLVAQKVAAGVYKGVTTSELDELAAETAAAMTSTHPDYAIVSATFCSSQALPAHSPQL